MTHPEPPAAPAGILPPPIEVAAAPSRTYREWYYSDAAINPAPDCIAGYLAEYRFAGEGDTMP